MSRSFRKKPVVVVAMQWTGENLEELLEFAKWARGATAPHPFSLIDGVLCVDTLEGVMRADRGDWLIRGIRDEFYPCKPDIFAATYDEVQQP